MKKTTEGRRFLSLKRGNYITKTDYDKLTQRMVNVNVGMNVRRIERVLSSDTSQPIWVGKYASDYANHFNTCLLYTSDAADE